MSRSLKKGPYVTGKLMRKVMKQKDTNNRDPIKTWARRCTIVPEFVAHTFMIHNGRQFVKLYVTEDMVGHKLGEFAPTRIFKGHGATRKEAGPTPGGPGPGSGKE
jgi:small subunit ribosomal protein S19